MVLQLKDELYPKIFIFVDYWSYSQWDWARVTENYYFQIAENMTDELVRQFTMPYKRMFYGWIKRSVCRPIADCILYRSTIAFFLFFFFHTDYLIDLQQKYSAGPALISCKVTNGRVNFLSLAFPLHPAAHTESQTSVRPLFSMRLKSLGHPFSI